MLSIVLKNFILFFLLVIIFHFLIINELVASRNSLGTHDVRRKTKWSRQEKDGEKKRRKNQESNVNPYNSLNVNQYVEVNNTKLNEAIPTKQNQLEEESIDNIETMNPVSKTSIEKIKSQSPSCDTMTRTSKVDETDPKMKELYDFVFDESERKPKSVKSSTTRGGAIVKDVVKIDTSEITSHHEKVTKSLDPKSEQQVLYNYEIIGSIDMQSEDGLMGIDTLSSENFSKII